ncbi:putative trans-aconitate 2-methyltransferase [Aspergillus ellipticus CBS 707.79]|uniref:Putative trans-aconitate 2-methyltransferase n=1 Tax=Aspergillus ellipticus CBS 707.79 TaxID=1448320 RepID=A0A319DPB2_9EURO|nr:putative trans-aconitate 2-methyltransferase [Aspergillus ellipticus CBS 707.79]
MTTKTWNAAQYLKFASERTLPARDLVSRIQTLQTRAPRRIIDLGCGPGNSTTVLTTHYPDARITGLDSSPAMIQKARSSFAASSPSPPAAKVDFAVADIATYTPTTTSPEPVDLYFSNAVFHWLTREQRIATIKRLMAAQPAGGIFAFQVPDNLAEASHVAMRETAAAAGPWRAKLVGKVVDREEMQSAQEIYDRLVGGDEGEGDGGSVVQAVEIWRTEYVHSLESHAAVVEWVKGTGLKPFLDAVGEGDEREAFLAEYLRRLERAYPVSRDGRVLLAYPRLFVVAVRK